MQNKTIKRRLALKIEDWLDSITDEQVRQLARRDVIVTGGSIVSMIMGDPIHDYDIYFKTKETTLEVAKYYVAKFIEKNLDYDDNIKVLCQPRKNINGEIEERVVVFIKSEDTAQSEDAPITEDDPDYDPHADVNQDVEIEQEENTTDPYHPVFLSSNAITLSNKMQLVTRFYGEPAEIHKNYDFVHAKSYFDYYNYELVTPEDALRSIQSKVLKYEGSLYPICSLFRLRKFIGRGWRVNASDILKMCYQIKKIDFSNSQQLRDQLIGCDALYFHAFIAALNSANPEMLSNEFYIFEIIDRVFNDN